MRGESKTAERQKERECERQCFAGSERWRHQLNRLLEKIFMADVGD